MGRNINIIRKKVFFKFWCHGKELCVIIKLIFMANYLLNSFVVLLKNNSKPFLEIVILFPVANIFALWIKMWPNREVTLLVTLAMKLVLSFFESKIEYFIDCRDHGTCKELETVVNLFKNSLMPLHKNREHLKTQRYW